MTMTLTPYLSFNGNCEEAMKFYHECLGGDLDLQKVGDSPAAEHMQGKENQVLHSMLKSDGIVLMASDMVMEGEAKPGTNMTLTLSGGSLEDVKKYFEKLSEGGKVRQPLQATFFGTYGDLVDKYGFAWAFQSDEKAE